ncbi:hypothetical protein [Avibacterium paragallinarum]|uniref:Uncharacterized protein n=1 Tax=Avibacterium paragallinarum TaxID=728 RepID=A0A0F5EPI3_AVIPA|nr:hypothetical protein [Avibacterium paragallinarum]KAA6209025.1 hypothetical protein F1968_06220 [Avibacterium paragallinarum]KKA98269.1 hypothetical protein Z012_12285 [Avibacterium paragallinarum]RZN71694.1 hypothetical protein EIG77_06715 [Avibacterium paragallinarum]SUU98623.1 Uncharacterised protein [Avibacterium paragallinarum]
MVIAERVLKITWGFAIASVTCWLGYTLFIPLIAHWFSSDLSFLALILGLCVSLLFIVLVWGLFGYATSVVAAATGLILGFIIEGIVWCYRKICP